MVLSLTRSNMNRPLPPGKLVDKIYTRHPEVRATSAFTRVFNAPWRSLEGRRHRSRVYPRSTS